MSKLLTKILITRAANTNQQLPFKCNFTHSPTVFCSFIILQKGKKISLFLAKTALSCCWTLTHGHPSGFWQKQYWKKKKRPGPLGINVTWTATGLMSVWFETGEWHSTL